MILKVSIAVIVTVIIVAICMYYLQNESGTKSSINGPYTSPISTCAGPNAIIDHAVDYLRTAKSIDLSRLLSILEGYPAVSTRKNEIVSQAKILIESKISKEQNGDENNVAKNNKHEVESIDSVQIEENINEDIINEDIINEGDVQVHGNPTLGVPL